MKQPYNCNSYITENTTGLLYKENRFKAIIIVYCGKCITVWSKGTDLVCYGAWYIWLPLA